MYYVYLIKSIHSSNQKYIGHTDNLRERLETHNSGGSVYTKPYRPWELIMAIAFEDKLKAIAFEKYLKSGAGRAFSKKAFLVVQNNLRSHQMAFYAVHDLFNTQFHVLQSQIKSLTVMLSLCIVFICSIQKENVCLILKDIFGSSSLTACLINIIFYSPINFLLFISSSWWCF